MKRLLLLVIFASICVPMFSQFGDTNIEETNLHILAKTWGLLKYHHPDLKNCEKDWDQVLINSLAKLDGAPQSALGIILEEMLDAAGDVSDLPDANLNYDTDERVNNLNRRWVRSLLIPRNIKKRINNLYDVAVPDEHCTFFYSYYLEFSGEEQYDVGPYPDKYMRALAFFRYWNIIDYLFPYKYEMDTDWNVTFKNFALPIINAETELDYHLEFKKLTVSINDSHSFFNSTPFSAWLRGYRRPYVVKLIEDKNVVVLVDEGPGIGGVSPDIEVGDIVLSINGTPIEEIREAYKPYALGSNQSVIDRTINDYVGWSKNTEDVVQFENEEGQVVEYVLQNKGLSVSPESKPIWEVIEGECADFGYIDMGRLQPNQIGDMVNDLWDEEYIIFDIRNYPNGTMWPLLPYLYDNRIFHSAITFPVTSYPGVYEWEDHYLGASNNRPTYQGQIRILFNEVTQSQAEFTIMGLEQHPGALKIGSQTSGADGNTHYVDLPGEIRTYFTGLGIYYPDKTPTQRIGIVPDIEVLQTIQGIRDGRDELLEVAMNCDLTDEGNFLHDSEPVIGETNMNDYSELLQSPISFDIYPNPVTDNEVIFIHPDQDVDSAIEYEISDRLGRIVKSGSFQGSHTSFPIQMAKLVPGLYHLTLKYRTTHHTKQIVVLR